MTTAYPTSYDSFTNPTSSDNLNNPDHAEQHANANDAIEAIEYALGLDPANGRVAVIDYLQELQIRADEAQTLDVISYAATTDLDFDFDTQAAGTSLYRHRTLSLAGNVTFTTSNLAAGLRLEVLIFADGSSRNFTFPAGWRFIGAAMPASIAANKVGRLRLISTTAANSGVIAEWVVQA